MLKSFFKGIIYLGAFCIISFLITLCLVCFLFNNTIKKDNLSNTISNILNVLDNGKDEETGEEINIIKGLLEEYYEEYPDLIDSIDRNEIIKEISYILTDSIHYELGLSSNNFNIIQLKDKIEKSIIEYENKNNLSIDRTSIYTKLSEMENNPPFDLNLNKEEKIIINLFYGNKILYYSGLIMLLLVSLIAFINQKISSGVGVFAIPSIIVGGLFFIVSSLLSSIISGEPIIGLILKDFQNNLFITSIVPIVLGIVLLIINPKLDNITKKELTN